MKQHQSSGTRPVHQTVAAPIQFQSAGQSVLSRFFQGFASAGRNLACFRRLFGWCLERLPSRPEGYALDLDSTRLLHEDGHQEGVAVGYTRLGTKPCLHPLLAGLSEVRLVAAFWLRADNSSCANNVVSFFLDLWDNLPHPLRRRVVRADSGFCVSELLWRWDQLRLKFVVVARLTQPVQRLIRQTTTWAATEVEGTDVAEVDFREADWPADTRLILIRHRVKDKRGRAGGKMFFERKLGWLEAVTVGSLRYWLFVTAGVISHPQGRTTIKLAVPTRERDWWRRLWGKLLSPFPNCHAVENRPPAT